MQLGYVGTNWYSVSDAFVRERTDRQEPICAPGYVYNGQNQCVKIADSGGGSSFTLAQPANITVSPVISSQVSPQISPAFQQQFQPSNSPATAATTQTAPTNQASAPSVSTSSAPAASAPASSGYSVDSINQLLREQAARYDAILASAIAAQPAPVPSTPAANVSQASPLPSVSAAVIPALPGASTSGQAPANLTT